MSPSQSPVWQLASHALVQDSRLPENNISNIINRQLGVFLLHVYRHKYTHYIICNYDHWLTPTIPTTTTTTSRCAMLCTIIFQILKSLLIALEMPAQYIIYSTSVLQLLHVVLQN